MNKKNKNVFAFFLSAIIFICILSSVACASDWPQFQKDKTNSGVTKDEAPTSDPMSDNSLSWERKLSSNIDIAPIVDGDLVYVATGDNKVYAIDKVTGNITWENSSSGSGFLLANIASGKNMIFVPTKNGRIYAFDADTGVEMWDVKVSSNQLNTPVTFDSNRIYFGDAESGGTGSSSDGTYYCYDVEDGTELWSRDSTSGGGYYWAGAAVKGNYLIYGDDKSHLTSVEKDTGNTIDEIDVSSVFGVAANEIRSSIVCNSDRLYFTSKGGYCFALGFNDSSGTFDTMNAYSAYIGPSVSTPTIYNGKVYVGSAGALSCLNASDLTNIWAFAVSGDVKSSPALSERYDTGNGNIYIYFTTNSADGRVYCLKDYNGNINPVEQWSYEEPGKTDWSLAGVAISDGWIYYGTDTGYLFGLTNKKTIRKSGGSSGGGGSGSANIFFSTGEAPENIAVFETSISYMSFGHKTTFEFYDPDNYVTSVYFDAKQNCGKQTAIVEVLNTNSTYATSIEEPVYKYLNIWIGKAGFANPARMDNMTVEFKVLKPEINESIVNRSTITLNRFYEDEWRSLNTEELEDREDNNSIYFRAETTGISPFAITYENVSEVVTIDEYKVNSSYTKTINGDFQNLDVWNTLSGFAMPERTENMTVEFSVLKSEINESNVNVSTITLNGFHDDEWKSLKTEKLEDRKDNNSLYFRAETTSISPFKITAEATLEAEDGDQNQ
ncbi:PGF-pre-PGF domain-containing protein [Methanococcoides methylutens]|uniref:PGF-pre-PGF domain-containing protein n=1 Tax=Methanococcoides methylutens TaxID=2226 RepID=UPI0040448461